MKVNFIYTYSVDMEREQEGFFIVTPPEVNSVLIGTKIFLATYPIFQLFLCYCTHYIHVHVHNIISAMSYLPVG